jgi:WD40 repeat protein
VKRPTFTQKDICTQRILREAELILRRLKPHFLRFVLRCLKFYAEGMTGLPGTTYRYNGFISYRHTERESAIARALQKGLSRFAKPFWRIRAARIFRDETNLSASPDLFGRITEALDQSQHFLLMASPEAATSPWVAKELTHWFNQRQQEGMIVILTDGEIWWDPDAQQFDSSRTDALPAALLDRFVTEPLFVDLRWAKVQSTDLDFANPRFSDVLATISAALRKVDKDEIAGEHVYQRRVFRISVAAIIAALIGLSAGLTYWAIRANHETEVAQAEKKRAEDAEATAKDAKGVAEVAKAAAEAARAAAEAAEAVAIKERNKAQEERNRARIALASAQRNESLTLAEQSLRETASGDAVRGMRVALSALPTDRANPDRPFVPRAEFALAKAVSANRLHYAVTPTKDWVNAASFNLDGSQIAMGTRDGFLKILDSSDGRELRSINEHRKAVMALAYSADGKLLAAGYAEPPSVTVRNAATGERIWSLRVNAIPHRLMFTPDGSRLISGALFQGRPHVWDTKSGDQISILNAVEGDIKSMSVSSDGRLLAFTTYFGGLFVCDIETSALVVSNTGRQSGKGLALDFSSFEESESIKSAQFAEKTGELVLVGRRTIYVVDPRTREITRHWKFADERESRPDILLVSSDAKWAVIATSDTQLATYSLVDGSLISKHSHTSKLTIAAKSPDDRIVVAAADNFTVRAWISGPGGRFAVFPGKAERIAGLAFSTDGTRLILYGDDTARIWDVREDMARLSPLPPGWRTTAVSPGASYALVSQGADTNAAEDDPKSKASGIWSIKQSALAKSEDSPISGSRSERALYFSASDTWMVRRRSYDIEYSDGNRATAATAVAALWSRAELSSPPPELPQDHVETFEILEAESQKTRHVLVIQRPESLSWEAVVLSDDGSKLGLAGSEYGDDGIESEARVEVWDTGESKKIIEIVQAGNDPSLKFSSDQKMLVLSTELKLKRDYARLSVWDLATGVKLTEFERPLEKPAENIEFVKGRDRILLGDRNTPPVLKELSTGRDVGNIAGKRRGAESLAISEDRLHLLVNNSGTPPTLWNVPARQPVRVLPDSAIVYTGDGRRIVIRSRKGSDDNLVEVIDCATGKSLKQIRLRAELLNSYAGLTGARVFLQTDDRTIEIHDVDSTAEPRKITLKDKLYRWRLPSADERLVTVDESGDLQIWNVQSGKLQSELRGADKIGPLGAAKLALHRIPVILADGAVAVLDTDTGDVLWRSATEIKARAVDLAPDGNTVIIRGAELIGAFDVATGERIGSLNLDEADQVGVNFSEKGDRIFIGIKGTTSVLLDAPNKREVGRYEGVELVTLSPGEPRLALASGKKLQVRDAMTGEIRREVEFPQDIRTIEFDRAGEMLAVVTAEPKVIALDVRSGAQNLIASPRRVPKLIAFGPNSAELIIHEDSNNVTLRDTASGKILTEFASDWTEKTSYYNWIRKVDPTGTYVAVRSPDNYIRVFRTADGSVASEFNWDDKTFAGLVFTSNGQRLVLATERGDLLFWNIATNQSERVVYLDREYSRFQGLNLRRTSDPFQLLAIDRQGRVDIISLNTHEGRLFSSGVPEADVNAALSDDGAILATMGGKGVLRLWHTGTREVILEGRLTDNKNIYSSPDLRFSADGKTLIVTVRSDEAYLIKLPPFGEKLVSMAKAAIGRSPSIPDNPAKPAQTYRLGIFTSNISSEQAEKWGLAGSGGALVLEVLPDSIAQAVGVRVGDVILEVDGKTVKTGTEVSAAVKAAGVDLSLLLFRGGETMTVKAMLGD